MAFNQDVKAVVPTANISWMFLAYWFVGNSERMLSLVTEATHGTKRIELVDLLAHPVALPPRCEQEAIVDVLTWHDARIARETEQASKLRLLKQGLMEDLLTGRVRVTPLLESTSPEAGATP